MKSDKQLKSDIEAELDWDPAVHAADVGVAVKEGIVTLTDHLDTHAEKAAVEHAVARVSGVTAIALDLEVRLSPDHVRDDTDIAKAAQTALLWNSGVPTDKVHVKVDKGWITLSGELERDYQRVAAEKAVRSLIGVCGVGNLLRLKARATPRCRRTTSR